ncbi:DNA-binding protein H-NS [Roseovarius sp. MBR-78]|jgi:DNA-binding protein H-NS|uniref:H-NS histone family protein n=1 Tax=Roseovarius sp. MBR-78 TaxID=3156460 RepID=UPI003396271C
MTNTDLNALSLKELRQLQKDVARAIEGFEERQKAEARARLEAMARDLGYSLAELAPSSKAGAKVPKYCHPDDPRLTWTGRGRKPGWFIEAVAAGHEPDDMLIAKRG